MDRIKANQSPDPLTPKEEDQAAQSIQPPVNPIEQILDNQKLMKESLIQIVEALMKQDKKIDEAMKKATTVAKAGRF